MRKLLLVTAMVLISASAQAGQSRSLSLASVDDQTAATQAKTADATTTQNSATSAQPAAIKSAETSPSDTPKFVERPPGVNTVPATTAPATATTSARSQPTEAARPVASHAAKASRGKHKTDWTEVRIIGELHRHGIYW
jgi:hypothetical protein